jgi:hypothetical protein
MTSIDDLFSYGDDDEYSSEVVSGTTGLDDSNDALLKDFYDLSLPSSIRMDILRSLMNREKVVVMDAVNNLCVSYLENKSSSLESFLKEITTCAELYFPLRLRCCNALLYTNDIQITKDEKDPDSCFVQRDFKMINTDCLTLLFDLIDSVLFCNQEQQAQFDVTFALLFETACIGLCEPFQTQSRDRLFKVFSECVTNKNLKEGYRYKLVKILSDNESIKADLFVSVAEEFFTSDLTIIVHSIFVLQLLKLKGALSSRLLDILLERVNCLKTDNEKADVADFLLSLDEWKVYKDFGKEMLTTLGGGSHIYDNAQNVHQVSIELEKFIEMLLNSEDSLNGCKEDVTGSILSFTSSVENCNKEKVKLALDRILLDNGLYGSKNLSLLTILFKLYNWIQRHPESHLLNTRLIEELEEMSETCSTGHLIRLANVLSGIETGFVTMSARDEIKGVVHYRLQRHFEGMSEEQQDAIMEDLMTIGEQRDVQKYLYRFFSELHDELERDYVHSGVMASGAFTEAFRDAVTSFST